jgi:hypothetical protein
MTQKLDIVALYDIESYLAQALANKRRVVAVTPHFPTYGPHGPLNYLVITEQED